MSVINEEKYIEKSIISLLNQTYSNFELLILDDFSSDKTLDKLKYYENKDKRIRLFTNKFTKGLASNLNFLIKKSKFEYLARADADDFYHTKRLELQKNFLDNNKNIDILGTDAFEIDRNSNIVGNILKSKLNLNIKNNLYLQNPLIHSSVMMRKSKLKSSNYYFYNQNLKRVQDYDLWLRKFYNENIFTLNQKLTYYRNDNRKNFKIILKDFYYGNLVRIKNIKIFKKLIISLCIFNFHKFKTLISLLHLKKKIIRIIK